MDLPRPPLSADLLNPPVTRRLSAICLILVVVIGAWLRSAQINEPLWVDELHTSWVVADGLQDIPTRAAAGNQSPPFFFAVWGSTRLVGHSEWGLRLPSLLAGVALIAFAFECGRRWSGSRAAGLLIALLVAVNHECILFANEARPYAWLQLFSLLHAGVYVRVLTRPTPGWRVLLVAGAIWLFYLHYTAALFLLAEAGCYGLLRFLCSDKVHYRPKQWLVDWVVVLVLVLPSFPHLAAIAQRRENWERFVRLTVSPGVRNSFWIYVIAPLAGLGISRLLRRPLNTTTTTKVLWIWVACWLAGPPAVAWTATLTGVAALWMLRYFVASLAAAIILAGLVFARYPSNAFRWIAASLLVVAAVYASGIVSQWRDDGRIVGDRNEDWPAAVAWLNRELPHDACPVFLCPGLIEDLALLDSDDGDLTEYCLFPLQGIYRLPGKSLVPLPTTRRWQVTDEVRQLLLQADSVGVLVRARPATADIIQAKLAAALSDGNDASIHYDRRMFGFLTAIVMRRAKASP